MSRQSCRRALARRLLASLGPQALALVTAAAPQQPQWPTLAEELKRHALPITAAIDDGDRRITSYGILDTPDWFAIGYYWHQDNGLLPDLVRIRTFDKRRKLWRSTTVHETFGSILHVRRHHGLFYVTGHSSPSAAPTLVLATDLKQVRLINGWPELMVPDGRVIFHDNLVHFAPAHPGVLSIYDPASDSVRQLYPAAPYKRPGLELMNRSFGEITWDAKRSAVIVRVVESAVTIQPDNRGLQGPERRYTVTCTLSQARARCAATESGAR